MNSYELHLMENIILSKIVYGDERITSSSVGLSIYLTCSKSSGNTDTHTHIHPSIHVICKICALRTEYSDIHYAINTSRLPVVVIRPPNDRRVVLLTDITMAIVRADRMVGYGIYSMQYICWMTRYLPYTYCNYIGNGHYHKLWLNLGSLNGC